VEKDGDDEQSEDGPGRHERMPWNRGPRLTARRFGQEHSVENASYGSDTPEATFVEDASDVMSEVSGVLSEASGSRIRQ
jgi:hypothetical protein